MLWLDSSAKKPNLFVDVVRSRSIKVFDQQAASVVKVIMYLEEKFAKGTILCIKNFLVDLRCEFSYSSPGKMRAVDFLLRKNDLLFVYRKKSAFELRFRKNILLKILIVVYYG